jgi:hydroxymethylpyrimidine/phosphomethylpyrimidine kinase
MTVHIFSIAGSDPSGGAGIQADLKTFAALGAYGMAAITALTAQNTRGVSGVYTVPAAFVTEQIDAIFADIRVDALKTGMLANAEIIRAVAASLRKHKPAHFVLDPVMAASSGDALIDADAIITLKQELLPLATVITPNIREAEILLGKKFTGDLESTARDLRDLGAPAVLLKGGHLDGRMATDCLVYSGGALMFEKERIKTVNTHGTGCTLSAALAVYLAQGLDLPGAVQAAKAYLTGALRHADDLEIGGGSGPVHHLYKTYADE